MNPNEAANVAASAGVNGSTPTACATGITIGTTTEALAVLLVVSEIRIARTTAKIVIETSELTPNVSAPHVPIVSASPVSCSSDPKMIPEPNRMMVPQSISFASFQVSVNSRLDQLTGSRNSSDAASTATMPSSSRLVTSSYACDSSPATIATMPGTIHSVTATANAI